MGKDFVAVWDGTYARQSSTSEQPADGEEIPRHQRQEEVRRREEDDGLGETQKGLARTPFVELLRGKRRSDKSHGLT